MLRKFCLLFAALIISLPAWAEVNLEPLLNRVTLTLQAEQWLTTKTALVNVGINAAVTDQGIEKIQAEVMQRLNSLATAEWHLIAFNRQQDRSGLESIQITAQARLLQTDLSNLRSKAKNMSKPGETFTVDDVQFTPSDDEMKQANIALRNNIYQQAKNEIDALNKAYPDQKFYLHQIDFNTNNIIAPVPMPMMAMSAQVAGVAAKVAAPLSVGNKMEMQATVVLTAMPTQVSQQLPH